MGDKILPYSISRELKTMEAIIAGAAFIALFSLWVVVPKLLLKK